MLDRGGKVAWGVPNILTFVFHIIRRRKLYGRQRSSTSLLNSDSAQLETGCWKLDKLAPKPDARPSTQYTIPFFDIRPLHLLIAITRRFLTY
jgi:hypothetical protein